MPSPHRRQRAPSPPTAWGRCAAVKGSLRRPGRLKILPEPQRPTPCQRRHIPTVDRGVPPALDRRSAPARRHPRQPRSSPDWTRLTHVAIAPNIPRIAAGHPNNQRFTDGTISPSLSHWTAGGMRGRSGVWSGDWYCISIHHGCARQVGSVACVSLSRMSGKRAFPYIPSRRRGGTPWDRVDRSRRYGNPVPKSWCGLTRFSGQSGRAFCEAV